MIFLTVGRTLFFLLLTLFVFASSTPGWSETGSHYQFDVDEDALHGPLDLSWLNRPLGAESRLFVKNGHFYRIGPDLIPFTNDDTRERLFGVNLSFAANFPNQEQALRVAKRLRKLGFNAVRLHHLDSAPSTQTDPPSSVLTPGPYPSFNEEAL